MSKTKDELISFWKRKESDIQKSADFLLFDPVRSQVYLETLPFIRKTIEYLEGNIITISDDRDTIILPGAFPKREIYVRNYGKKPLIIHGAGCPVHLPENGTAYFSSKSGSWEYKYKN